MVSNHKSKDKDGIYLGLGSNLGNREENIRHALEKIGAHNALTLLKTSSIYRSKPWGMADQPWFLNAVCEIASSLEPSALLDELKKTETKLGRKRYEKHWGPRIIDIDIILYRDLVLDSPDLTIPHKYCIQRLFVIMPLLEINPEILHPQTGKKFQTYFHQLKDRENEDSCSLYKQKD